MTEVATPKSNTQPEDELVTSLRANKTVWNEEFPGHDIVPVFTHDEAIEAIKAYGNERVSKALSTIHGIANDLAGQDKAYGESITPYFGNAVTIYQEYLKGDNYERIDVKALKLPTLEALQPKSPEKE